MNTKTTPVVAALGLCLVLTTGGLAAQDAAERIVVPLSEPGQPAVLTADLMNGSIRVEAYDGNEILVRTTHDPADDEGEDSHQGLTRIVNTSVGLTVEERDNRVTIEADWSSRATRLEVQVPRRTSVRLATVNNGDIHVEGVEGTHELSNVNGAITALGVTGSVVADTTNGDVKVSFVTIEPDKPMSFSTWNGDVDLTVPADTRARLVLNSGQGDIYTDFEVVLAPQELKTTRNEGKRGFRVRVEKEVVGSINGGDAEFRFKTYNGDIFVRKN